MELTEAVPIVACSCMLSSIQSSMLCNSNIHCVNIRLMAKKCRHQCHPSSVCKGDKSSSHKRDYTMVKKSYPPICSNFCGQFSDPVLHCSHCLYLAVYAAYATKERLDSLD